MACRRFLWVSDLHQRDPDTFKPLHVVSMTIRDSAEDSAAAAGHVLELCKMVNEPAERRLVVVIGRPRNTFLLAVARVLRWQGSSVSKRSRYCGSHLVIFAKKNRDYDSTSFVLSCVADWGSVVKRRNEKHEHGPTQPVTLPLVSCHGKIVGPN